MRRVRLGWEYFCSGLWEFDPDDEWVSIEPENLPISDRLGEDIRRWAAEQTEAYNGTDSVSDEARAAWDARATTLVHRLSEELPGDFEVTV